VIATSSGSGPAPAARARSSPTGVLTDLKNRGVKDTFFLVCDGLKGLPEVVSNVWPQAIVQTCIIHLIRNTFRLTARQYWDEIKRDLKPIYTAVNATAARTAFEELADKWGPRYPAVVRLWDNAWEEFIGVPRLRSLSQNRLRVPCERGSAERVPEPYWSVRGRTKKGGVANRSCSGTTSAVIAPSP